MPITADQAREIANTFRYLSHDLGTFRRDNWIRLTETQRQDLENARLDLLNYATGFVTVAAGIALADMEGDLKAIANATAEAKKAVATIDKVKDIIKVASALVALGGAIASKQPSSIARAAIEAFKVANGATKKSKQ